MGDVGILGQLYDPCARVLREALPALPGAILVPETDRRGPRPVRKPGGAVPGCTAAVSSAAPSPLAPKRRTLKRPPSSSSGAAERVLDAAGETNEAETSAAHNQQAAANI